LPQVHVLLCSVLPRRAFDRVWALEVVLHWQQRNYEAYLAHRKRRLEQLNQLK
jgi:cyclopropane fatty-acyl-phospholipid synthase-like methyltransferase